MALVALALPGPTQRATEGELPAPRGHLTKLNVIISCIFPIPADRGPQHSNGSPPAPERWAEFLAAGSHAAAEFWNAWGSLAGEAAAISVYRGRSPPAP